MTDAALSPDDFRRWQDASRMIDTAQVVFIVGPPKSGTTWLAASLEGHPDAAVCHESHFANELLPRLRESIRHPAGRRAEFGSLPEGQPAEMDGLSIERALFDRILLRSAAARRGETGRPVRAFVEKTPVHARHIDDLAAIYPGARFICCTRDPRDCAVSAWSHFGREGWVAEQSIEEYAARYIRDVWAPCVRDARRSARSLPPTRYTEIDYADHKADPRGAISRLIRFCGLDDSKDAVERCLGAGDFRTMSGGRSPGDESRDSFYRKGVVGDWSNHFSPEVGERLLEVARESLGEVGQVDWLHECLWRAASARLREAGARRIAVFGAGRHTAEMLRLGWPWDE
ncbi:MAG: sulfotransferase, partial [Planctomycetota bacterium]|nr:sulfotransferase [Planctomycetota bacterium]